MINKQDGSGNTALKWAAGGGQLESVKILVEAEADLNTQDNDFSTGIVSSCTKTQNFVNHFEAKLISNKKVNASFKSNLFKCGLIFLTLLTNV